MFSSVVLPWLLGLAAEAADGPWRLPTMLGEASGLVSSRRYPGVLWTHNDSGDWPRVYGIDHEGKLLATIEINGAEAIDWEDIAFDESGAMWVGDFGNNANSRRNLRLYRMPEPKVQPSGAVTVDQVVTFSFPEQTAFPMSGQLNFDVESLFFADGTAWVLTKHRSDQDTVLYRFPRLSGEVELELVGRFTLGGDPNNYGGMATAADVSPDGQHLAVLSYHELFLFRRPTEGQNWLGELASSIPLKQLVTRQCEGIAWTSTGLYIANENRKMFVIRDPLAHRGAFPP